MKIFLTMITILAFTWSCSAADSSDGGPSAFPLGEIGVIQDGATPTAADGEAIEDDSGIIEIPIVLGGLTNRDGVNVDVTLTLAEGVTQHLTDDTNTETEGVLTLTITDPDGEEAVAVAELGRFVVESNSIQYNLIVAGEFAAQATPPAPVVATADTPDEIVVTLEGSTPTVSYDGALGYTVSGLTNSDGVADGSISIEAYAPEGFTAVLGSDVLADPDGTNGVDYAEFTTITVTEDAYPANEVIYTISGGFSALGGATPPPASSIMVTLPGSFSALNPTDTNLDVTLSGTTYTVAGLTNRLNEDVTFDTTVDFTVSFGYSISAITKTYTPTASTDASSGPVELGTFVITDDSITGDTGTLYTISGPFAAQATAPAPTSQIVVSLLGSTTTIEYDDALAYTVLGLTNREVNGTISIDGYDPAGFTVVLGSGVLTDLDGTEAVSSAEFTTITVTEIAYTANEVEYTISGEFAAQATAPAPVVNTAGTPNQIVVTLAGSVPAVSYDGAFGYTVNGLTNRTADGTISISGYDPAGFTAVLGTNVLTDPDGTNAVDYAEFTTITVTENAYDVNEVVYTISGGFAALGSVNPPPASAITVTFLGSFSVGTPTDTNLDVSLSGATYVVAGLTNRSNEGVTFGTNVDFTAPSGYTISPITNKYTPTASTDASSGAVELGTFTITDDAITGDTGTTYSISGEFAAQAVAPAPTGQIVVALMGSTTTIDYDGALGYTVNGLINGAADGTISIGSYNPDGFTVVLGTNVLEDPTGTNDVPSAEFTTITVTEDAYDANEVVYTISGAYSALVLMPPASSIRVTFPGNFSVANPTDTNLDVSLSGGIYTVAGLTNRPNEDVTFDTTVDFTVSSGYTISTITNTYTPTADTGASSSAVELGTFTVTDDNIAGDTGTIYTISGVFVAQAVAPAPTGQIEVTFEGSTIAIDYDGVLGYGIRGLINGNAVADGSISIDSYTPAGFAAVLGSSVLADPPGTGEVGYAEFTTITVTEDVYTANEVIYTISGGYTALGTTVPPLASSIMVSFPGSRSVINPANTNLDVSLSGTTYTVAGLTNRSNEDVTLVTTAGFVAQPDYTITPIAKTYTATADTVASSGAVVLGTFVITDDTIPGDVGTTYTISGVFAAQATITPPPTNSLDIRVTLGTFSSNIMISEPDPSDNTYMVTGITNRENPLIKVNLSTTAAFTVADVFTLSGLEGPNASRIINTPLGVGATTTPTEFATFTITEDFYTVNTETYTISGVFEAQPSIPTETASVVYNGVTNNITPGTPLTLTYVAGEVATLSGSVPLGEPQFQYVSNNQLTSSGGVVIAPGTTIANGNTVEITYTPTAAGTQTARYIVREINFSFNGEAREYTIIFQ